MVDIETDSLDPTLIWCVVTKDFQTKEVKTWLRPEKNNNGLNEYLSKFILVMHNGLWFDGPVLNKFCKSNINYQRIIDTLVVSRLYNSWDYNRHGLADWGDRLGLPKGDYYDFSKYTEEMLEYCKRDVDVTEKVFEFLKEFIEDPKNRNGLRNEHNSSIVCKEMHDNGFGFNEKKARELFWQIEQEKNLLQIELQKAFPPKSVLVKEVTPVKTKTGKLHSKDFRFLEGRDPSDAGYSADSSFSLIDFERFNPASTKQIIERLNQHGWKPFEKTKGHLIAEKEKDKEKLEYFKVYGWTVSEANLGTLPETAPEAAKSLVRYITLTRRLTTLTEWLSAYNSKTESIHGKINAIGTWTHRASHKEPNTGNIIRIQKDPKTEEVLWGEKGGWGADYRSLWRARKGWKLVGCDAEGIQLRVLSHYMDDPVFQEALISGKSKEGTDVHTLNWKALGEFCKDRNTAKTFIYAWVLGASNTKVGQILECSPQQAAKSVQGFLGKYPNLRYLKEVLIPFDVDRGYFVGFDGRAVKCDSNHLMLAGYLQNGETTIMKRANWIWREQLKKEKIPFRQVNFIHDEWQTEVLDQDDLPEIVGKIQADAIVQAGIDLGVKCPQAGTFRTGYDWQETH